ncbi:Rap1a/Tai family immunity protein [Devosia indica]
MRQAAQRCSLAFVATICTPRAPSIEPACLAYVTGVADTLEMVAPYLTNICRPSASTMAQVFDIAMLWLADNFAERHRPAAKFVGLALAEASPWQRRAPFPAVRPLF